MNLKVAVVKETFGNIEAKPVCQLSKEIAEQCGCSTFNSLQIKILECAGFNVEVIKERNIVEEEE